jgi:hypothetical protein
MSATEALRRLAILLPPLAAAAALPVIPDAPLSPALAFALLAAWGRLGSLATGASGRERALLFAELVPFLGYAFVVWCGLPPPAALLRLAECGLAAAALLSAESLLLGARGGFSGALAFIAASAGAGFAAAAAPAPAFLGAAGLLLAVTRYTAARRLA